jgi:hypothetical protein
VLNRLEKDKTKDVHSISVRWYVPCGFRPRERRYPCISCSLSEIVKRAAPERVRRVSSQLVDHLTSSDVELRDVYAIGLKTIIADADNATSQTIAQAVLGKLTAAVSSEDVDTVQQAAELLSALLERSSIRIRPEDGEAILHSFLKSLASSNSSVKKKVTVGLGTLAPHLNDAMLDSLITTILDQVDRSSRATRSRTTSTSVTSLIQVLGAVSRKVGWRLGRHLSRISPALHHAIGDAEDSSRHGDSDCELRETCFHAMESLVLRCPAEVAPFLEDMEELARSFLPFDPNYDYEGGADGGDDMDDFYADDDGDMYGGAYDDDDDADDENSWKVRRAAARLLTAMVSTRPELVRHFYTGGLAADVMTCFRERDENVKLDILTCFTALLRSTISSQGSSQNFTPKSVVEAESMPAMAVSSLSVTLSEGARSHLVGSVPAIAEVAEAGLLEAPSLSRQLSVAADVLPGMAADIVEQAASQAKGTKAGKGHRIKSAVLLLLRQLNLVLGPNTAPFLGSMIEVCLDSLAESVAALRMEALENLRTALDTIEATDWSGHLDSIVPLVSKALGDEWYRCIAEAVRVVGRIVVASRPSLHAIDATPGTSSVTTPRSDSATKSRIIKLLPQLYSRLQATDADQEVKEAAILTSGILVAYAGDLIGAADADNIQHVLLTRLQNEVTRTCALKSLAFIAKSPLAIDMSSILTSVVEEAAVLLRQKSRSTRQAALMALDAVVRSRGESFTAAQLRGAFEQVSTMVSDSDLILAQQAIGAADGLVSVAPPKVSAQVLSSTGFASALIALSTSHVLHGATLHSVAEFLPKAAQVGVDAHDASLSFITLAEAISAQVSAAASSSSSSSSAAAASSSSSSAAVGAGSGAVSKQSLSNAARCIAALLAAAGASVRDKEAHAFLKAATTPSTGFSERLLALYALGELGGAGANVLASESTALVTVSALFEETGAGSSEDVKSAAAAAVGGIVTGSTATGMPWLLSSLSAVSGQSKYLLLAALKGVISRHAPASPTGPSFSSFAGDAKLLGVIDSLAVDSDASVRAIAGECLGRLCACNTAVVLPRIEALATDSNPFRRACSATAFRFAASSGAHMSSRSAEAVLATALDADIGVKLAGLQAINVATLSATDLVSDLIRIEPAPLAADGSIAVPKPPLSTCGLQAVVFSDTRIREDLQRDVDMGPFKQFVDDGLPLRKAAFGCMEALFDRVRERLSPKHFIAALCTGLSDADDVMLLAHPLLVKLASDPVWSRHVVSSLSPIVTATSAAFDKVEGRKKKNSDGSGGSDVVRSALRALHSIEELCPEAGNIPSYSELMAHCASNTTLGPMLAAVRDSSSGFSSLDALSAASASSSAAAALA